MSTSARAAVVRMLNASGIRVVPDHGIQVWQHTRPAGRCTRENIDGLRCTLDNGHSDDHVAIVPGRAGVFVRWARVGKRTHR